MFHKTFPLLSWFKENKRKVNLDKCPLFISGPENVKIILNDFTIINSKKEKLLCTFFDDGLKFRYIIENMCKKASLKLSGLFCVAPTCQSTMKENFIQSVFSVTV